jgi:hypothetical protein
VRARLDEDLGRERRRERFAVDTHFGVLAVDADLDGSDLVTSEVEHATRARRHLGVFAWRDVPDSEVEVLGRVAIRFQVQLDLAERERDIVRVLFIPEPSIDGERCLPLLCLDRRDALTERGAPFRIVGSCSVSRESDDHQRRREDDAFQENKTSELE